MSYYGGKIGKPRKLPILIDVDGVIADFHTRVCDLIEEKTGIEIDQKSVYENYTDIREAAGSAWNDEVENEIKSDGFAQTLKEYPGAVEAVKKIMKLWEVVFVTSPYPDSKYWYHDRHQWLQDRFNISRDDVIFARDKRFVCGLTLIDDRKENILDWSIEHGHIPILMVRPWNSELHSEDSLLNNAYRGNLSEENADCNFQLAEFYQGRDWNSILEYLNLNFNKSPYLR